MKRIATILVFSLAGVCPGADAPTPPSQPQSGPGGADYKHATVTEQSCGAGGTQCWLFEPAEPAPKSAPGVIFLHGWGAMEPSPYHAWINHLARPGNIGVYPRYQETFLTQ